jgi:hypothetical protein
VTGTTRILRITALLGAFAFTLAAVQPWQSGTAAAEAPDLQPAPAVDDFTSQLERAGEPISEATGPVQEAAGDATAPLEDIAEGEATALEPVETIIPQPPANVLPEEPDDESELLDPVFALLPTTEDLADPPPPDPITDLLPSDAGTEPVGLTPERIPGDTVSDIEVPDIVLDEQDSDPLEPLAPIAPVSPLPDITELPDALEILPDAGTITPGEVIVPDLTTPAPGSEPAPASGTAALPVPSEQIAGPPHHGSPAPVAPQRMREAVEADPPAGTPAAARRGAPAIADAILNEFQAPESRAIAPGTPSRFRASPNHGGSIFVPSTLFDLVAMFSTGALALLIAWYWLRWQQADDGLVPAFAAGPNTLETPARNIEARPSPPSFPSVSGHRFPPTIASRTGHANTIATANPASSVVFVAPPAQIPAVPPTTARVSVVIPAKNEERNLPALLDALPPWLHEVILVDGLSSDATSEVARRHLSSIRIVSQKGRGKGNALREGFAHCTGDVIIAIDADGSMDPDEISTFAAFLDSGFDYVKGSRMLPGGGSCDLTPFRRLGNWFFRSLTNALYTSNYSDLCYGYFGFRRGTIDALDLRSDGFEIETEINIKAHTAGFRTAEIPSTESPRINGKSNLRALHDGFRILRTILGVRAAGRQMT